MNNSNSFFYPFNGFQGYEQTINNYEKIIDKINRMEKAIQILENKVDKLEKRNTDNQDEPTDMYMI